MTIDPCPLAPAAGGDFSFLRTESQQRFAQLILKNMGTAESVHELLLALQDIALSGEGHLSAPSQSLLHTAGPARGTQPIK